MHRTIRLESPPTSDRKPVRMFVYDLGYVGKVGVGIGDTVYCAQIAALYLRERAGRVGKFTM